jgi:hypothetical protein
MTVQGGCRTFAIVVFGTKGSNLSGAWDGGADLIGNLSLEGALIRVMWATVAHARN